MSTSPMPVPQTPPATQDAQVASTGEQPDVSKNVMPIGDQARQLAQAKPGVSEAQMGQAPKAQGDAPSKKRVILSVLGAAAGLGPMVQQVNQKHNQDQQIRNQHVIDNVWQSHNNETQARNRIDQLKPHAEQIQQMMKEVQALPDSDPTKVGRMGFLAHNMQDIVTEIQKQAQTVQQSQQNLQAILADPKNRKLVGKAVGYDEKFANSPERQQMVAAIQKSVPGTSPQEAQMESQFPQGESAGQPGLTPEVQKQVLQSATEQAKIGGRQGVADTRGQAQVQSAEIRARSVKGKTGVQFDQGVPYAWTGPDGKNYAASDPNLPPEGKTALSDANVAYQKYVTLKKQAGAAASQRAHVMYLTYLERSQGIDEKGAALPGSIQTDTGQTVGTANAANVRPTGTERGRADLAASAKEQMDDMTKILTKRSDLFGPVSGRKTNFTEWVGSQDPDAQAFQAAARVAADHLAGVFGGRSEAALSGIYNVIGKNATNPKAAIAALQQMYKAADKIQGKGTIHAVGSSSQIGGSSSGPLKAGTVEDGYRFKGGDPADKSNWTKVQ